MCDKLTEYTVDIIKNRILIDQLLIKTADAFNERERLASIYGKDAIIIFSDPDEEKRLR